MTGEELLRIAFTEDVVTRDEQTALLFSMQPDFPFVPDNKRPKDIFHPNDVEELSPELASAFPQFDAGDILVSIRNYDMIAVLSPKGDIKWHHRGPWLQQHDPDFEPDGRIALYNNAPTSPRSFIYAIDPKTGEVEDLLPNLSVPFKSKRRGKHQQLPNGNRLITVPEQGQAIEVTADGVLAAEFNNVLEKNLAYNEDLVNAKWLPADYFSTVPQCSVR